jgi:uncharacterized membrane protein
MLVSFVLSSFVTDLFTNLYADTKYSPALARARVELVKQLPSRLKDTAASLDSREPARIAEALAGVLVAYFAVLRLLNTAEEGKYSG